MLSTALVSIRYVAVSFYTLLVKSGNLEFRLGRFVAFFALAFILTACQADQLVAPNKSTLREVAVDSSLTTGRAVSSTGSFAEDSRATISLSAEGLFAPGKTVALIWHVKGIRATTGGVVRLRVEQPPSIGKSAFVEELHARPIGEGAELGNELRVSFAEAGYYHVLATVGTSLGSELAEDRRRTSLTNEVVAQNLWILVDETGGRVDTEYDQAIARDTERYLTNGSTGAFRSRLSPRNTQQNSFSIRGIENQAMPPTLPSKSLSVGTSVQFNGRITFLRNDGFGDTATVGVSGARVSGSCMDPGDTPLSSFVVLADTSGAFSVTCSGFVYSILASGNLQSSSVQVNNYNNSFAGAYGRITVWDFGQVSLAVNNNDAAQVFLNHQRYNTAAPTMFGRTRGLVTFRVSNSVGVETGYNTSNDIITIGPNKSWGRNGIFTTTHEFGHAFHWGAIDPWSSYAACPVHYPDTEYSAGCAYVEGFADFFAARVVNSIDGSASNGDFLSQNFLEQNSYRSIGNGLRIEGTIAALMLDLVDSSIDDDGISGDDDSLNMSLFELSQIMRMCRMSNPSTYLITHADQFVYCTAGSVAERTYAPSWSLSYWGVYSGLSYDAPTTRPSQSVFRALWRYNLYNL